jgi:hypothetical protein
VALQTEFEEFVALTACVVEGCVVFGDTVGDGYYPGRGEGAAGEGAFIAACCWIGTRDELVHVYRKLR